MPTNNYVSVRSSDGTKWAHRVIAEHALGRPLPSKVRIHHVDGDGRNNAPGNLVICEDQAYHSLLHRRMRVKAAGGDPDTHLWCSSCRQPRPVEQFTKRVTGPAAGHFVSCCRYCLRLKARARKVPVGTGRNNKSKMRYCPMCDLWLAAKHKECPECGADTYKAEPEPEDDRDEDYERANIRWRETHGGEL